VDGVVVGASRRRLCRALHSLMHMAISQYTFCYRED
jgi:hypothetical protein